MALMFLPQFDRIKLEHSYAYETKHDSKYNSVVVKEEPVDNEVVENIKIEITNDRTEAKQEPTEDVHSFEYLSIPSGQYQYALEAQDINIKTETNNSAPSINNTMPPLCEFDPLTIVDKYVGADDLMLEVKKTVRKRKPKGSSVKDKTPAPSKPKKERVNWCMQVKVLQKELQAVEAKEKLLVKELSERTKSERALVEKNLEYQSKIEVLQKMYKSKSGTIHTLNQRLHKAEKGVKNYELAEKQRKETLKKLERFKKQVRISNIEQRKMDAKCTKLIQSVSHLTTVSSNQKMDLDQALLKLKTTEDSLANCMKNCEALKKSLHAEKKMSRCITNERDQLLAEQESKFTELDKKLAVHKESVQSLTIALKMTVAQNNSLKDNLKKVERRHQQRISDLNSQLDAVKQLNTELQNLTCRYCGL